MSNVIPFPPKAPPRVSVRPTIREVRFGADGKYIRDADGRLMLFPVPPERRADPRANYADDASYVT